MNLIFANWLSVNAFVSGARDQWFIYRHGPIGLNVANGWPPLRHFLKGAVLPAGEMMLRKAPPSRYMPRRNTVRIMKGLIKFDLNFRFQQFSSFKWLQKRAKCDQKALNLAIFSEKLQK